MTKNTKPTAGIVCEVKGKSFAIAIPQAAPDVLAAHRILDPEQADEAKPVLLATSDIPRAALERYAALFRVRLLEAAGYPPTEEAPKQAGERLAGMIYRYPETLVALVFPEAPDWMHAIEKVHPDMVSLSVHDCWDADELARDADAWRHVAVNQMTSATPNETSPNCEAWQGLYLPRRARLARAVWHLWRYNLLSVETLELVGEVSSDQARRDIAEIRKRLPDLPLTYDRKAKCYRLDTGPRPAVLRTGRGAEKPGGEK